MLRSRRSTPLVVLAVLVGLLVGCSAPLSEEQQAAANLQSLIDTELSAMLEGDPNLSIDDATAEVLYWMYTDGFEAAGLIALGYTPDQLLRGITRWQCNVAFLTESVASLTSVGLSPVEIAEACLSAGATAQFLADTGAFSSADLVAAQPAPSEPPAPNPSAQTPPGTPMTFADGKAACSWLSDLFGAVYPPNGGLQGTQAGANKGAPYFSCVVGVMTQTHGVLEMVITINPPRTQLLPEWQRCVDGNWVTSPDNTLATDAHGGYLNSDNYNYCVYDSAVRVHLYSGSTDFLAFIEEVLSKLRGEAAEKFAALVADLESTP